MAKLSIVIPSRDERFLTPTIDDIFRNARGEVEVIAVLDSNTWPADWKEVTDRHPNLHTIHHGAPRGMRAAINSGVGSAMQRGAKYVMKLDGHCMLDEGFDLKITEHLQPDWVMVPRRKRLDADNWTFTDIHKLDIDYHYLSFPDDPNDFGGKGLNGKVWEERARSRQDILIDDEMASQGSAWAMFTDYFYQLDLMDEESYGPFWNESQEIFNKCWLSGGRCVINKHTWYAHLHKGTKHGRGYRLPEAWLQQGAAFTKNWIWNDAWSKQTLPFKWLIEHFWPVPSWPENWEEILYAQRKPRDVVAVGIDYHSDDNSTTAKTVTDPVSLKIYSAYYGIGPYVGENVDVTERLRSLVKDSSLDIIVNNSTLTPNQNLFRGKKKHLVVVYSIDKGEDVKKRVEEKDWLIIGPPAKVVTKVSEQYEQDIQWQRAQTLRDSGLTGEEAALLIASQDANNGQEQAKASNAAIAAVSKLASSESKRAMNGEVRSLIAQYPMTPAALNDYLIRKFSISPQRLRGPMPIELHDFHRNDLAQLFAELGFKRGAEIGVAEGNYSEILLKANPECELLLVDPWHRYSDNPQNKSEEKHTFAWTETLRKTKGYNVHVMQDYSMNAVREIKDGSLDFCYIDGNHLFDYVIQDLVEWSKRVRSGGIVSGDDYYALDQKRWVGGGVVEAVQAYANAHRIPIWYLFSGHKSVDFMWIKP